MIGCKNTVMHKSAFKGSSLSKQPCILVQLILIYTLYTYLCVVFISSLICPFWKTSYSLVSINETLMSMMMTMMMMMILMIMMAMMMIIIIIIVIVMTVMMIIMTMTMMMMRLKNMIFIYWKLSSLFTCY